MLFWCTVKMTVNKLRKSKDYGLVIHRQKALGSCIEKLSTFRSKETLKQKF